MNNKECELKKMSAQARAHALWFAGHEQRKKLELVHSVPEPFNVASDIDDKLKSIIESEQPLLKICNFLLSRVQTLEGIMKVMSEESTFIKEHFINKHIQEKQNG